VTIFRYRSFGDLLRDTRATHLAERAAERDAGDRDDVVVPEPPVPVPEPPLP
jgi:hypothetical protein